jgi:hypothetical protein
MAHAQKPDFVFRRNGRVHFNRQGCQFSRLLAGELCTSACRVCTARASLCSAVMWRLLVTPLHSLVSPSLLLPCFTVYHHISTVLCHSRMTSVRFRTTCLWFTNFWKRTNSMEQLRSEEANSSKLDEFPTVYETRSFITVFTIAQYLYLPDPFHTNPSQPISLICPFN